MISTVSSNTLTFILWLFGSAIGLRLLASSPLRVRTPPPGPVLVACRSCQRRTLPAHAGPPLQPGDRGEAQPTGAGGLHIRSVRVLNATTLPASVRGAGAFRVRQAHIGAL